MEEPRHDLPTLHRPVSREDYYIIDRRDDLSRDIKPIPHPPHKSVNTAQQFDRHGNYKSEAGLFGSRQLMLPDMLTDKNWQALRAKNLIGNVPHRDEFDKSYEELSSRKAFRYPHPGVPKSRAGCIGGTWRHMREAIGYGPGRLMWVDGVVTLYDDVTSLNNERPWSKLESNKSVRPASNEMFLSTYSRSYAPPKRFEAVENQGRWYSSNKPQPLPFAARPPQASAPTGRYRGFYSMEQTYA